jgi:hypothetical protein
VLAAFNPGGKGAEPTPPESPPTGKDPGIAK